MTRFITLALAIELFVTCGSAQIPEKTTGTVRGVVVTLNASASPSAVPGTRVTLDGPVHAETESDSEGKIVLVTVPPGSYTITAQAPGMTTQQNVTVTAGAVSEVSLEV